MASKIMPRVRPSAAFALLALVAVTTLFLGAALTETGSHGGGGNAHGGTSANPALAALQLPIYFEKNQGQANPQAHFLTRTAGNSLFLTDNAAVFSLIGGNLLRSKLPDGFAGARQINGRLVESDVAIRLLDANPHPVIEGEDALRAKVNYLIGSDPKKWHRDIPTFGRVHYRDVYPGIDLVFYGTPGTLEYDLIAKPGADPSKIRFAIDGADHSDVGADGNLNIHTAAGTITMVHPRVYQSNPDGSRSAVPASFTIGEDGIVQAHADSAKVAIALGNYDRSRTIMIDPQIVYSTYYGGGGQSQSPLNLEQFQFVLQGQAIQVADGAFDVAIDSNHNAYLAGQTFSTDLPGVSGHFQTTLKGANTPPNQNPNSFVAKFDPSRTGAASLVWATYIGGSGDTNATDAGHGNGDLTFGVAVDGGGEPTIVGQTYSTNFPDTSACGTWGRTNNQKATSTNVGFISELSASGNSIVYSCYIPGMDNATAARVKLQKNCTSNCDTFVVGSTQSSQARGFVPVTANAFQTNLRATNSKSNAFVLETEIVSGTPQVKYCSYYGGSGNGTNADAGLGLDIDGSEHIVIAGATFSSDLSLSATPLQSAYKGGANSTSNGFVAEFDPGAATGPASLLYATYIGGTGATNNTVGFSLGDGATAITQKSGKFYLTGFTSSTDFFNFTANGGPTANAFQSSNPDAATSGSPAFSAYVVAIDPSQVAASQMVYGSYFGGTGFNALGVFGLGDAATDIGYDQTNTTVYLTGGTTSSNSGAGSWISSNSCQTANNSAGVTFTINTPFGPQQVTIPITAFVSGLNITAPKASQLVFGRYLGGSGQMDLATGLTGTMIGSGSGPFLYVSGITFSGDFPVTTTGYQQTNHAIPSATNTPAYTNAFLTILDPSNSSCAKTGGWPTATATATATAATATATPSATGTVGRTATATATPSRTATSTRTATATATPSKTATATATTSRTATPTRTATATATASRTATPTATATGATATATPSKTATATPTKTATATPSKTATATPSRTATATATASSTATATASATATATATAATPTPTPTTVPAALSFAPKKVNFPAQIVLGDHGVTSKARKLKLTDLKTRKQNATITITSIDTDDDAEFNVATACVGPILPGKNCSVEITFTPNGSGKRAAHLMVQSDATNPQLSIPLSGVGREGKLGIVPRALTFKTQVGTPQGKPLKLINKNPIPLHIDTITSPDGHFVPAGACNDTNIAPSGGTCTETVTFTPTAKGKVGPVKLSIEDEAAGSPQLVNMVGTGK